MHYAVKIIFPLISSALLGVFMAWKFVIKTLKNSQCQSANKNNNRQHK